MRTSVHRFGRDHHALILTTFLAVLVTGGIAIATKAVAEQSAHAASEAVAGQAAKGCARNQIQRGYLLLRAQEFGPEVNAPRGRASVTDHAPNLFYLVNCEASYTPGYHGPAFRLPPEASQCFLRLMADGYWNDHEPFTDPDRLRAICRR